MNRMTSLNIGNSYRKPPKGVVSDTLRKEIKEFLMQYDGAFRGSKEFWDLHKQFESMKEKYGTVVATAVIEQGRNYPDVETFFDVKKPAKIQPDRMR